jgi:hypothetical protein
MQGARRYGCSGSFGGASREQGRAETERAEEQAAKEGDGQSKGEGEEAGCRLSGGGTVLATCNLEINVHCENVTF